MSQSYIAIRYFAILPSAEVNDALRGGGGSAYGEGKPTFAD